MMRVLIALVFLTGCTQEGTLPAPKVRDVTLESSFAARAATALFVNRPNPTMRSSGGVWDSNDVKGPWDFRWVGAAYTATGAIHLSVSFHDAFRRRLLPRYTHYEESRVGVRLSGALSGYFFRASGRRIVFIWGDFGSGCCERDEATQPSSRVITVTFDPCDYGYGEEIDLARGDSLWARHDVRAQDSTREVALNHPECGFAVV